MTKAAVTARRAELQRPYANDHAESVARNAERGQEPRVLGEYLVWFSRLWRAEMPTEIHGSGPFFGPPDRPEQQEAQQLAARSLLCGDRSRHHQHLEVCWRTISPKDLVGGSHLGSPNLADPFRRLMENSPFESEFAKYDGHETMDRHYVRPVHAAIARMGHRWPIAARWLASLAACDFDWQALATRRGWTHEEAELFLEKACHLLWWHFDEQPGRRQREVA